MQFNNKSREFLLNLDRQQLLEFVESHGLEKYRADQIFRAIYTQSLDSFDDFTTLSKPLRKKLSEIAVLRTFTLEKTTSSPNDNTTKFLWKLSDGLSIESVIIYEGKRITFCISSQVGCALDCKFCSTGKMGFIRNLTPGEIVEQVMRMKDLATDKPTNIVYMGMGEPMLNLKNVHKAAYLISEPEGLAFSRKKITISTSGVTPGIRRMADENSPFSLAVSLNAVFEDKRREIMPVSGHYPLTELAAALEYYVNKLNRRVTFEYILIGGKNDTEDDARELLRFTARFPCKINLIPCNSMDPEFPPPAPDHVKWFNEFLNQNQRTATTRMRKGWEIQAACGQLYAATGARKGTRITEQKKKLKLSE